MILFLLISSLAFGQTTKNISNTSINGIPSLGVTMDIPGLSDLRDRVLELQVEELRKSQIVIKEIPLKGL